MKQIMVKFYFIRFFIFSDGEFDDSDFDMLSDMGELDRTIPYEGI